MPYASPYVPYYPPVYPGIVPYPQVIPNVSPFAPIQRDVWIGDPPPGWGSVTVTVNYSTTVHAN